MTSHPSAIMLQKESFMKCWNVGVGEAEEHDSGFRKAFVGDEGSFPLVTIFDSDIVIAPSDVEFGE